jgi:hypothetical protein
MPKLLEMPHLVHNDRMAQMQVRRGGIESDLDIERRAAGQLFPQFAFVHKLENAALDRPHLFVNGFHRSCTIHGIEHFALEMTA